MGKINFLPYWYKKEEQKRDNKKIKGIIIVEIFIFSILIFLVMYNKPKLEELYNLKKKKEINFQRNSKTKEDGVEKCFYAVENLFKQDIEYKSIFIDKDFVFIEVDFDKLNDYKKFIELIEHENIQILSVKKMDNTNKKYNYKLSVKINEK
ncbi:hypothetical protein [Clostridium rectalis]|uniref:hypothetical protein n=1 Tax=Clostridium rectalis TaxID=2040295 RepID=UPI000F63F9A4|nr:hypothetical protein [Clostridium rectalis]